MLAAIRTTTTTMSSASSRQTATAAAGVAMKTLFPRAIASATGVHYLNNPSRLFTSNNNNTSAPLVNSNPLELMKETSMKRRLCNSDGVRLPRVQWVFQLAVAQPHTSPPSLKTVNFQRISDQGLDFVMKRPDPQSDAPTTANVLAKQNPPVSVLYTSGTFQPGDIEEQWRGEGYVEEIPLKDLLPVIPNYSLVGILSSKRAQDLMHKVEDIVSTTPSELQTEVHRTRIEKHCKFIQLVQKTRNDLENNLVDSNELEESIMAFRMKPSRLERMVGSPDLISMDRWEWIKMIPMIDEPGLSSHQTYEQQHESDMEWSQPRHLLPF